MRDGEASSHEVALRGEIDLANARTIGDELCAAVDRAPDRLVVDLSSVTFLDTTAMGMMLRVHQYAVAREKHVTWWNAQDPPARAIKMLGLNHLLDFAP